MFLVGKKRTVKVKCLPNINIALVKVRTKHMTTMQSVMALLLPSLDIWRREMNLSIKPAWSQ